MVFVTVEDIMTDRSARRTAVPSPPKARPGHYPLPTTDDPLRCRRVTMESGVRSQAISQGTMARPIVLLDLDDTLVLTYKIDRLRRQAQRREVPWNALYAVFDRTTVPPGTHEFVQWLTREATVGVVTSAPRQYAERLLRMHRLSLPVVVAYHDTKRHKPDPQPLARALELLDGQPADAVSIGDLDEDATAALNAGLTPLQMDWDADVESEPDREPRPGTFRSWTTMREALRQLWAGDPRPIPDTDLIRVRPDDYDEEDLAPDWEDHWHTPNAHATLTYHKPSSTGGKASEAAALVLDFKGGRREAVGYTTSFLEHAVKRYEVYLRDVRRIRYVAAIPGHVAASGYLRLDQVARSLADRFPWLASDGIVERVRDVPKSSTARERPAAAVHAASMRWQGPGLTSDDGVLLIDDVLTSGATFAGAQATLRYTTACRSVVGMFLARTYSSSPSLCPIPSVVEIDDAAGHWPQVDDGREPSSGPSLRSRSRDRAAPSVARPPGRPP